MSKSDRKRSNPTISTSSNTTRIIAIISIVLICTLAIGITATVVLKDDSGSVHYASDFSFIDIEGVTRHLSDYSGKIVLLDCWATWCQPCGYQMFELQKVYDHYEADQVVILSIDIDDSETLDDIQTYIDDYAAYGYDLEWVFGSALDNMDSYMPSGGIPTLTIFDVDGSITYQESGVHLFDTIPEGYPADTPLLEPQISALLS